MSKATNIKTVKDLIEYLNKLNPDSPIYINHDIEDPNDCSDIVSVGYCDDGDNSYYALCYDVPKETFGTKNT